MTKPSLSTIILGTLLGLIIPMIGIFIGLQVNTTVGTILAWPLVLLVALTGVGFGQSTLVLIGGMILSIVFWTAVVHLFRSRLLAE